ncbi:MAG: S49 family peptidase, partial [Kiritimatiellaeota bacterium]|nr:S49 family peptidase [Kiritimatiellota bacterium]
METYQYETPPPPPNTPPVLTPSPAPANPTPKKIGHSCFNGCLYMSFGIVVIMILGMILSMASCMFVVSTVSEEIKAGLEGFATGAKPEGSGPKVQVLNLNGVITLATESSFFAEENSSVATLRAIRAATDDKSIRGIFLRVSSGGGEITASDIIWKALRDFKEADTDRLVVVHMGSIAASGAYYISCAADKIVAHPTTMTGSIGVKISSYNARELAEKIGI